MEDEKDFEPEEFHKLIIEVADAALTKFPRLTSDDREAIETGRRQFKHGLALLDQFCVNLQVAHSKANDPELWLLRDAAKRLMWGAYAIGSRANVSDSAIIFRNINRHGPGGKKGAKKRNEKADVWKVWVRHAITKNVELTPDELAEKLRFDSTAPRNLPCYDRLARFIRKERKAHESGEKRKLLRLVRG